MQKKVKTILQKEEKVLRQVAKEIPFSEIKSAKIKKIIKEMSEALASQDDGVAIAAPQIGYSLRIFLVAGRVFDKDFLEGRVNNKYEKGATETKDKVFINPEILKLSKDREWMPEGCLSVRPIYGEASRSTKATVIAYDEDGNKFTYGGSGLLAQIFQHETDHLNGILFIDHARKLREEDL